MRVRYVCFLCLGEVVGCFWVLSLCLDLYIPIRRSAACIPIYAAVRRCVSGEDIYIYIDNIVVITDIIIIIVVESIYIIDGRESKDRGGLLTKQIVIVGIVVEKCSVLLLITLSYLYNPTEWLQFINFTYYK